MAPPRRDLTERFFEKVAVAGPLECWEWTAARAGNGGYGVIGPGGRAPVRTAHRIAYELTIGPIPDGLCVLHECDNPPCVNPRHLYLGTLSDNARDMWQRGRARAGPNHHSFPRSKPVVSHKARAEQGTQNIRG